MGGDQGGCERNVGVGVMWDTKRYCTILRK